MEANLITRRACWEQASGILEGFVIAEIELKQETEELALPRWIGREVTGDSHYRKINMVARRAGSQR
jgi:CYTH domain-containing protein